MLPSTSIKLTKRVKTTEPLRARSWGWLKKLLRSLLRILLKQLRFNSTSHSLNKHKIDLKRKFFHSLYSLSLKFSWISVFSPKYFHSQWNPSQTSSINLTLTLFFNNYNFNLRKHNVSLWACQIFEFNQPYYAF